MIESTVLAIGLATGGCFLTLTVTVSVDLVADHVVDPADLVDLVVDLVLDPVLRSVIAFLTVSVLCDLCVECLDCNLCLGSTFDHCVCNFCSSERLCFSDDCIRSFNAVDLWSVAL